jgi:hypothetical protein
LTRNSASLSNTEPVFGDPEGGADDSEVELMERFAHEVDYLR